MCASLGTDPRSGLGRSPCEAGRQPKGAGEPIRTASSCELGTSDERSPPAAQAKGWGSRPNICAE